MLVRAWLYIFLNQMSLLPRERSKKVVAVLYSVGSSLWRDLYHGVLEGVKDMVFKVPFGYGWEHFLLPVIRRSQVMPPCVLVNRFVGFWQEVLASILSDKLRAVKRGINEGIYLEFSAVVKTAEKECFLSAE